VMIASTRRGFRAFLLCFLALWSASCAWGALDASQVLILVNRDVPASGQVAQMYQRLRGIPAANVLRLSMGTNRQITPEQYWKAGVSIRKYLEEHTDIVCILTTTGVPYTVQAAEGDEGAAFDNELAVVLREEPGDKKRHQPNPLYLNGMNPYVLLDPRALKTVYVARLDGPDLATVTRMVEDAIETENSGFSGLVAGDAEGLDAVTGYGEGDATIRAVVDRLGGAGFPVNLDMRMETWKRPATGVGTQAARAGFYVGWYALLDFQDIFGESGLARGSIAWHIASQEAQDIWNPNGHGWCVNLMRRGAAVTLGPVREPYVWAFPHGDVFVEALLNGLTVAESYWLSLPQVSWAMVILGDPLYRPFALHPRPAIVARSYVSTGANQVLVRGESSSLLVQLECVGVPGSSTPPLSAVVEPEMGLTAASGEVTIPAMRAGETTVVRIPKVTAGDDPNGMFRLALRTRGDLSRRIVLEGRIGFSRLTGGIRPESQLFVNPEGSVVITGQPGRSILVHTNTLQTQPLRMPDGFGLANAEFASDGAHLAIALLDAQKKQGSVILADGNLGSTQSLPTGTQFVRWLDTDRVLLAGPDGLVSHSISGGEDRNLGRPPGKTGNVVPGTEIQFSLAEDGQVLVKNGAATAFREVLKGSKVNRFIAIANDLSLFGGVDGENRLWVQHGIDGQPEVIATGVAAVLWGPISRKVLVENAEHHARIYDGRDGSWKDLGVVALAEWSADEESLLFVEATGSDSSLSLLSRKTVQKLCPIARIGQIVKMSFSADQKRAFLLASLSQRLDVWMMPLPPPVPLPPGQAK
jgi:uncharacterized protein (TIGR03790 family)